MYEQLRSYEVDDWCREATMFSVRFINKSQLKVLTINLDKIQ